MISTSNSKPGTWLSKIGLILLGLGTAFFVLEISFRLLHIQIRPTPKIFRELDDRTRLDTYPTNPRNYFKIDLRNSTGTAYLDRLLKQNKYSKDEILKTPYAVLISRNSKALRNPEFSNPPKKGTIRILVMGDSMTEGEGVNEEDAFVRKLDQLLQAHPHSSPVEIINGGHRGYDIWQIYDNFKRKILRWHPDIVLYVFTLNDTHLTPAMRENSNFINDLGLLRPEQFAQTRPLKKFLNHFRVFEFINFRLARRNSTEKAVRWYQAMTSPKNEPAWSKTQELIAKMAQISSRHHIRFCATVLPLMFQLDENYPFRDYHRQLVEVFEKNDIPVLDLFPSFKGQEAKKLIVHPADFHPNEIGHQIIAEGLYPFLDQQIIQVQKPKEKVEKTS